MAIQLKSAGKAPEKFRPRNISPKYGEYSRYVHAVAFNETHYMNLGSDMIQRDLELLRSHLYSQAKRHGYKVRTNYELTKAKAAGLWDKGDHVLFIIKLSLEDELEVFENGTEPLSIAAVTGLVLEE
jgi:hypothetical protein